MAALTRKQRDTVIRTVAGEAMSESDEGRAAVAHVIRNRTLDGRWSEDPAKVATQKSKKGYAQFSTWNTADKQGNNVGKNLKVGSPEYERLGKVVDGVFGGSIPDPTKGATHYYAPKGMPKGKAPSWWGTIKKEAQGVVTKIGGHIFSGLVKAGNVAAAGFKSAEQVMQTQRDLQKLGMYDGPVDGRATPELKGAIRRAQEVMNGDLKEYGLKPIKVDGKWGPKTQAAAVASGYSTIKDLSLEARDELAATMKGYQPKMQERTRFPDSVKAAVMEMEAARAVKAQQPAAAARPPAPGGMPGGFNPMGRPSVGRVTTPPRPADTATAAPGPTAGPSRPPSPSGAPTGSLASPRDNSAPPGIGQRADVGDLAGRTRKQLESAVSSNPDMQKRLEQAQRQLETMTKRRDFPNSPPGMTGIGAPNMDLRTRMPRGMLPGETRGITAQPRPTTTIQERREVNGRPNTNPVPIRSSTNRPPTPVGTPGLGLNSTKRPPTPVSRPSAPAPAARAPSPGSQPGGFNPNAAASVGRGPTVRPSPSAPMPRPNPTPAARPVAAPVPRASPVPAGIKSTVGISDMVRAAQRPPAPVPRANPMMPAAPTPRMNPVAQALAKPPKPAGLMSASPSRRSGYDAATEALQRDLQKRGYSPGKIDGIMGPKTRAAMDAASRSSASRSTGGSASRSVGGSGSSASRSTSASGGPGASKPAGTTRPSKEREKARRSV